MIVLVRLTVCFYGLDELQYVIALYLPVREEAVNRILLVVKHLEYRFQFCCRQQFDMSRFDIKDCQRSPCLPQLRQSKEESSKAGRVELSQIREIQCHA